jgi:hypothetical protein
MPPAREISLHQRQDRDGLLGIEAGDRLVGLSARVADFVTFCISEHLTARKGILDV